VSDDDASDLTSNISTNLNNNLKLKFKKYIPQQKNGEKNDGYGPMLCRCIERELSAACLLEGIHNHDQLSQKIEFVLFVALHHLCVQLFDLIEQLKLK
jgi:hypothetical protein